MHVQTISSPEAAPRSTMPRLRWQAMPHDGAAGSAISAHDLPHAQSRTRPERARRWPWPPVLRFAESSTGRRGGDAAFARPSLCPPRAGPPGHPATACEAATASRSARSLSALCACAAPVLVAAHPVPAHRGVARELGLERLDQVAVLDRRAARRPPAAPLPSRHPQRHRLEQQQRVRRHARMAPAGQPAQPFDGGRELHAVVRRVRHRTRELDRPAPAGRHDDRGPAAGPGVPAARPVRPYERLARARLNRCLADRGRC